MFGKGLVVYGTVHHSLTRVTKGDCYERGGLFLLESFIHAGQSGKSCGNLPSKRVIVFYFDV